MKKIMPSNYEMWGKSKFEGKSFLEFSQDLISVSSLAASSHNTQPWHFVVSEKSQSITLKLNNERVLSVSDVNKRQAIISCGCALENMRVALDYHGVKYSLTINSDISSETIAEIKIHDNLAIKKNKQLQTIFDSIFTRRVNRSKCTDKKVPDEFLDLIMKDEYGLEIRTIKDMVTKNAISEIQEQADRFVLGNDKFRKELGEWLLPNSTDSYLGMPGSTFGLKDVEAEKIHKQLLSGKLDYDLASGVAVSDRQRIQTSPLLLVITGKDTKEDWIKTGCLWQKIALIAESMGISVAVSAAIVEVPLLSKMMSVRLGTTSRPLMITTIGYATEERPHSPRLPVSQLISFSD